MTIETKDSLLLPSAYLDGEIRGQIIMNPGTSFAARLTTGAEVGGGGGGGGGY